MPEYIVMQANPDFALMLMMFVPTPFKLFLLIGVFGFII